MPHHLGLWEGTDTPMAPEIRAAVGADIIVDRLYTDSADSTAPFPSHLAVFSDWDLGLAVATGKYSEIGIDRHIYRDMIYPVDDGSGMPEADKWQKRFADKNASRR